MMPLLSSSYPAANGSFVVLWVLLTGLNGLCEPASGSGEAQGSQADRTRAWIEAGRVVDPDHPAWKQLQSELGKGFQQTLAAGLRALTNDLPDARRQFVLAVHEAKGAGSDAHKQAQRGIDYVDALIALNQAGTLEAFESSWARVQETEAVLPASWPRVGTNVAVQVAETRARKALEEALRQEALEPLDAKLSGLEVTVGLRKPSEGLKDPVTDRPAAPLVAGVDSQSYFKMVERLQRDFERYGALTPERRQLLQQIQRRLQLFPGAY